jgi:hypothetical protein
MARVPTLARPSAWQPPQARIDGDRLLKARQAEQRVMEAKAKVEAEAKRVEEMESQKLDEKVDDLREQLDRLTSDLPKIIPSGGGGKRMVERVFQRDRQRYQDALGIDDISKTEAQFDKDGYVYSLTAGPHDVATKIYGELDDTRSNAKSLVHIELRDAGSGTAAGPQVAGFGLTVAAFKKNFPSLSAEDGEIDSTMFTFRQVNGDATCQLGNGVVINGYAAFAESLIASIDSVTFAYKHLVKSTTGVVNDRDDLYYGSVQQKLNGEGGDAFYASSNPAAGWTRGLNLNHKNKAQLQQRTADAALLVFEYDTPANYAALRVVGGVPQFTNSAGTKVDISVPARTVTAFTPVFTASGGTLGTQTATGSYIESRDGRYIDFWGTATIDNNTGSTSLSMTLPVAVVTESGYYAHLSGRNHSTGVPLFGVIASAATSVAVVLVNNGYPISGSGVVITFSGRYRKA